MKEAERENLKNELLHLKKCQIQYFVASVTAAGIVAGFGREIGDQFEKHHWNFFLAPLLIILPCWWIFFDKGSTITRIVGYLQLLEGMILTERTGPFKYLGWENSLELFRKDERKRKVNLFKYILNWFVSIVIDLCRGFYFGLLFQSTQKYWSICWYTFLGLSVTSLWLSFPGNWTLRLSTWNIFFAVFIISFLQNLRVLGRLIKGKYSYVKNYERWRVVLNSEDARKRFVEMFSGDIK